MRAQIQPPMISSDNATMRQGDANGCLENREESDRCRQIITLSCLKVRRCGLPPTSKRCRSARIQSPPAFTLRPAWELPQATGVDAPTILVENEAEADQRSWCGIQAIHRALGRRRLRSWPSLLRLPSIGVHEGLS